jgi:hypothetical protein
MSAGLYGLLALLVIPVIFALLALAFCCVRRRKKPKPQDPAPLWPL